jgi:DHA1 family inner membrane transport protein
VRLRRAIGFLTGTRLVVNTNQRFVFPFLPAIARGLGISLERAGLLLSARSLAFVATPVVVGTVGRGERRVRLVVFGLSLMAAGTLITASTGVAAGALVGFVLVGIGKPSFDAAAQAYVADRTPFERRARHLSILELTWAGGLLVGAPLAGWLISRFGWRAPFWVMSGLFVVAAVAAPRVLEADGGGGADPTARLRPDRPMVALLATGLLFSFSAETTFVVFGAWLEDGFALSLAALGLASTAIAVAELVGEGSVLLFADRVGPRRMVAGGLAASVAGYLALGAASGTLAGGMVALALTLICFEITIVATVPLATEAAPHARGRFLAWLMVAIGIGRSMGDAAGPALYSWHGVAANATASAAGALAALVVLLGLVPETVRDRAARS